MTSKAVRFNTSISIMISDKLNEHAKITGLTKSAIVSQALIDYFHKNDLMENGIKMVIELCKNNPDVMNRIIHGENLKLAPEFVERLLDKNT